MNNRYVLISHALALLIAATGLHAASAQEKGASENAAAPTPTAPSEQQATPANANTGKVDPKAADKNAPVERWEYSAYKVKCWLAFEPSIELPKSIQDRVLSEVVWQGEQVDLSSWVLETEYAPASIARTLYTAIDGFTLPTDPAELETYKVGDKLMLISVSKRLDSFVVKAREFDVSTEVLGPVFTRTCASELLLASTICGAVSDAFSPIAKILSVESSTIVARPRAQALINLKLASSFGGKVAPPPTHIKDTDILIPVLKQKGSFKSKQAKIKMLEWTCMKIDSRDEKNLTCTMESMVNGPLDGRTNSRAEKLAIVSKPAHKKTTILLQSRATNPTPLSGYRLYYVEKGKEGEKDVPVLIGKSDWRGAVEINQDRGIYQTIFIRNGQRTLAKLPIVVGHDKEIKVGVLDDETRMRAEGMVRGLQNQILDLVARREVMATMIRKRVETGDVNGARKILEEFRKLPTEDFLSGYVTRKRASLRPTDKKEVVRIDTLFGQLSSLIKSKLSNELGKKLENLVGDAANSPGTPVETPATDSTAPATTPMPEAAPTTPPANTASPMPMSQ